jgi:hypothetical protein
VSSRRDELLPIRLNEYMDWLYRTAKWEECKDRSALEFFDVCNSPYAEKQWIKQRKNCIGTMSEWCRRAAEVFYL